MDSAESGTRKTIRSDASEIDTQLSSTSDLLTEWRNTLSETVSSGYRLEKLEDFRNRTSAAMLSIVQKREQLILHLAQENAKLRNENASNPLPNLHRSVTPRVPPCKTDQIPFGDICHCGHLYDPDVCFPEREETPTVKDKE